MRDEKTIKAIKEVLEDFKYENYRLFQDFFNLLFWKNHTEGYVSYEDRTKILEEIEKNTTEHKGDINLNAEKILPFVNKIRKQIGLPELTNKLDNILQEITPEIRKKLILKGLE